MFNNHKTSQRKVLKEVCENVILCPTYDGDKRKRKTIHECREWYCITCNVHVNTIHECDVEAKNIVHV